MFTDAVITELELQLESRYNLKHKNKTDQIKDLDKAKHVIDMLKEKIMEK